MSRAEAATRPPDAGPCRSPQGCPPPSSSPRNCSRLISAACQGPVLGPGPSRAGRLSPDRAALVLGPQRGPAQPHPHQGPAGHRVSSFSQGASPRTLGAEPGLPSTPSIWFPSSRIVSIFVARHSPFWFSGATGELCGRKIRVDSVPRAVGGRGGEQTRTACALVYSCRRLCFSLDSRGLHARWGFLEGPMLRWKVIMIFCVSSSHCSFRPPWLAGPATTSVTVFKNHEDRASWLQS